MFSTGAATNNAPSSPDDDGQGRRKDPSRVAQRGSGSSSAPEHCRTPPRSVIRLRRAVVDSTIGRSGSIRREKSLTPRSPGSPSPRRSASPGRSGQPRRGAARLFREEELAAARPAARAGLPTPRPPIWPTSWGRTTRGTPVSYAAAVRAALPQARARGRPLPPDHARQQGGDRGPPARDPGPARPSRPSDRPGLGAPSAAATRSRTALTGGGGADVERLRRSRPNRADSVSVDREGGTARAMRPRRPQWASPQRSVTASTCSTAGAPTLTFPS